MTEERKQYLASISEEEQTIRYAIKYQQDVMSNCKEDLTNPWLFSAPANILKQQIADTKTIIQALKKQLPAPTRFGSCVICGCKQPKGHVRFYSYSYCAECGQKLR